jgi:hypothetical protein
MKRMLLLIASVSLCSCVSINDMKYPSDWAPRSQLSNTCKELAGRYSDHRVHGGSSGSAAYWAFDFDNFDIVSNAKEDGPRVIGIRFSKENDLTIEYEFDKKIISSITVSKEEYQCAPDYLEFHRFNRWGSSHDRYVGAIGHDETLIRLSRAGGSLIVHNIGSGIEAVAYVVPVAFKTEIWYRFGAVK